MEMGLKGKNAAITGGAMGIGQAIANALADEGVNIAILDTNVEAANNTRGISSNLFSPGGLQ